MGAAPYRVRAVDSNGNSVEANLMLTSGSQDSGEQFVCE
jgi:hypothetical protein